MKWQVKSAIQNFISITPNPSRLNYFFQHNLSKRVPVNLEVFFDVVGYTLNHLNFFQKYCNSQNDSEARFYEFGAGWDLQIPLTFYALGINHQTLIDIRPNIRFELINDMVNKFNSYHDRLENKFKMPFRIFQKNALNNLNDLDKHFGIKYISPLDAAKTGLPSKSFDFISSSLVLEHIPAKDIESIFQENQRLIKPDGIISCFIDLKDHYSESDKKINYYNFLKYPEWLWKLANSKIFFQNRLRFPDYMQIFNKVGFEIIEYNCDEPKEDDYKILKNMKLSKEFKNKYSNMELGIKLAWVVMRKTSNQ